jgi:hypothetical protein
MAPARCRHTGGSWREVEELFAHEVEVGVADMDVSTDDDVVSTQVVAERAKAVDRGTGQERELLLIYGAAEAPAVADAIRAAAERAAREP